MQEMQHRFTDLFHRSPLRRNDNEEESFTMAEWAPLVDIEEQDDAYVLEAELPGVKREDVNIEVAGTELSVTGEIKEKERKGALRRRTRRTGRFEYRVRLPQQQVDASKIEAGLDQGVLTFRVPKPERTQRQKIEIKSK